jgi:hypothetical protein
VNDLDSASGPDGAGDLAELDGLVDRWLSYREVGDLIGVSANKVRQMCRDLELVAVAGRIPADFLVDGRVVKGLAGTLTVLADSGYDQEASVRWLYRADDSLPGAPIVALREHRLREVRRRAQALAF